MTSFRLYGLKEASGTAEISISAMGIGSIPALQGQALVNREINLGDSCFSGRRHLSIIKPVIQMKYILAVI